MLFDLNRIESNDGENYEVKSVAAVKSAFNSYISITKELYSGHAKSYSSPLTVSLSHTRNDYASYMYASHLKLAALCDKLLIQWTSSAKNREPVPFGLCDFAGGELEWRRSVGEFEFGATGICL